MQLKSKYSGNNIAHKFFSIILPLIVLDFSISSHRKLFKWLSSQLTAKFCQHLNHVLYNCGNVLRPLYDQHILVP